MKIKLECITLFLDDEGENLKNAYQFLSVMEQENVVYASSIEEARSELNGTAPSIVVISCASGTEEAESMLGDLPFTPEWIIGGVTMEQASDPQFLRSAMNARFNDILMIPADSETLLQSIEAGLSNIEGSSKSHGKVLSLYSAKGGSGVSTIAVNLALALNSQGSLKVGLLDLDLQCGLVASLLNLKPTQTLGKLGEIPIDDVEAIREEVFSWITPHDSGLSIVASPTFYHDSLNFPASMITQVIRTLKGRFDILIVDTPKWVGDCLVAALDESDLILLVSESQIPSVAKTREALRLFSHFEYSPEKIELLFNRVNKKDEIQPQDVEEILDRDAYFSFPEETQRLTDAANHGAPPLGDKTPRGPFALAVTAFADQLRMDLGYSYPELAKKKRGFFLRRKSR